MVDPAGAAALVRRLAKSPAVRYVRIEDSAHILPRDRGTRELVAAEVTAFVERARTLGCAVAPTESRLARPSGVDRRSATLPGPMAKRRYLLAIDQGTTGTHVLVVDDRLEVVGEAYREFTQHFPQPGWVEHDLREIWKTVERCCKKGLADAEHPPRHGDRHRHHQPARDHGGSGTARRASRWTGPSSGRTAAPPTPAPS